MNCNQCTMPDTAAMHFHKCIFPCKSMTASKTLQATTDEAATTVRQLSCKAKDGFMLSSAGKHFYRVIETAMSLEKGMTSILVNSDRCPGSR